MTDWVAQMRILAQFREFTKDLEIAIRDRFILGQVNAK